MNTVGFTLYVLKFDDPITGMGTLTILLMVPWVLFGPFAGVLVDRWSKRSVIIVCDVARGALSAVLPFVANQAGFFLVIVLLALLDVLFSPAISGFLPAVVPKDALVMAGSLYAASGQVALLVGPAVGGLLVATLGFNSVFLINGLAFVIASVFSVAITQKGKALRTAAPEQSKFFSEMRDGASYARDHRTVFFVIVFFGLASMVFGALPILLPNYLTGVLAVTDRQYGFFVSVSGLGALAGALLVPRIHKRFSSITVMVVGVGAYGLLMSVLTVFSFIGYTMGIYFFVGIMVSVTNVSYGVYLQRVVDEKYIGRVFSLDLTLGSLMTLIAMIAVTWLARAEDIILWIVSLGALLVVLALVGLTVSRRVSQ